MSKNTVARIIGALVAIAIVVWLFFFNHIVLLEALLHNNFWWRVGVYGIIALLAAIIAFLISPYISVIPYRWLRDQIRGAAASDLVAAVIGLFVGRIISFFLGFPLSYLPDSLGRILPLVGAVLFGYLEATIAVLHTLALHHSLP